MKARKVPIRQDRVQKTSAEALRLAGSTTVNQRRFLEVGVTLGKDLEPGGALAGRRA